VTFRFENQKVAFTVGTVAYTHDVPDGQITFSNSVTQATTTFNTLTNTWMTIMPTRGITGRSFAAGLAYQVPVPGLPGNINPVTWSARISSDTPGLKVRWRWGAAVYSTFSTNYNSLGVKPTSSRNLTAYPNNDRAGTPENFKQYLGAGARSHGHNAVGWRSRSATTLQCGVGTWTTYTQSGWGSNPNSANTGGAILAANFMSVFGGAVTIGNTAPGKFTLTFTSAAAIKSFLPAGGKAGVLQATATNPANSKAGVFAGQVLALKLNVDSSNQNLTGAGLATLKVVDGPLAGYTVQQVLDLANSVLGGGTLPAGLTLAQLNDIVTNISEDYESGKVDRGFLLP
jgi:hypothetical protein